MINIYTIRPTKNSTETYYRYMISLIAKNLGSADKFIEKEYALATETNASIHNAWTDEMKEVSHVFISKLPNEEKTKVYKELEKILEREPNDIDELLSIRECDEDIVIINFYTRFLHALNLKEMSIDIRKFYHKKTK